MCITARVWWNLCKYSVCTWHVMQTGRVVTRASLVCLMSLPCLIICHLTQTGRMFHACTRFSHFQITVSNTFYFDTPSAILTEFVNVSFSKPFCVSLWSWCLFIPVVSQSLVQGTHVYLWINYFFCLQDNSQAFRGCVFRWNDGCPTPRKVQSNSVVASTCVTKSRL
jgi:hypothetical protein